jgi:molecular chaperone GrpE
MTRRQFEVEKRALMSPAFHEQGSEFRMIEKNMPARNRIPVHFMDEEKNAGAEDAARDGEATPEELGRASSYEDETEMRRRMNRGEESDTAGGRGSADERDDAGSPRDAELPENREEQDTTRRAGASSELELLAARAEVRLVEDELQKAKSERHELIDLMARRQADFENYRKRMERERGETYQRLAGELARQILPVLDNLQRACDAESSNESSESEEFRNFLHGVELIAKQLNGVLENLGVVPVETVGQKFDPHVHEAVATERTEEFEPDTVMQEMQRGYRIGDRLLRPAMVKVATR